MKKIDKIIQIEYYYFGNLKTNFSENMDIKQRFMGKLNKVSMKELTTKELDQLEWLLLPQATR